jgi:hypothetical protein
VEVGDIAEWWRVEGRACWWEKNREVDGLKTWYMLPERSALWTVGKLLKVLSEPPC